MKIIFLDIDGVLNTIRSYYATGSQETWDAIACKYLQVLLKYNNDLRIVVSSTWRYSNDCLGIFKYNGFDTSMFHKHWRTPIMSPEEKLGLEAKSFKEKAVRGIEIQRWLSDERHSDVTHYCIIDDDDDMLPEQEKHFVQVPAYDGILYSHMDRINNILELQSDHVFNIEHIVSMVHEGYYSLHYPNTNKTDYKHV